MKVCELFEATRGGFNATKHIGKSSGGTIWGTSTRLSSATNVDAKPKIPQPDPKKPKPTKIISPKLIELKKKWAEEDKKKAK